jgi:hypothetical protein
MTLPIIALILVLTGLAVFILSSAEKEEKKNEKKKELT